MKSMRGQDLQDYLPATETLSRDVAHKDNKAVRLQRAIAARLRHCCPTNEWHIRKHELRVAVEYALNGVVQSVIK